jgi:hypothetical protein
MPIVVSVLWAPEAKEPTLGFHDNEAGARDYIQAQYWPDERVITKTWAQTTEALDNDGWRWAVVHTNIMIHSILG